MDDEQKDNQHDDNNNGAYDDHNENKDAVDIDVDLLTKSPVSASNYGIQLTHFAANIILSTGNYLNPGFIKDLFRPKLIKHFSLQ